MALSKLKLATFNIANAIVNASTGTPTVAFHRWISDVFRTIQDVINALGQQSDDIVYTLAQVNIAIQSANSAAAAASSAATAASAAAASSATNLREQNLVSSYVTPSSALTAELTTDPLVARIVIANHTRVYGDGASVAVTGSTISGLALSTTYYVTYMDVPRTGGPVTYSTTTDPSLAGQGLNQHLVGGVTTPATGATTTSPGATTRPPGISGLALQKMGDQVDTV